MLDDLHGVVRRLDFPFTVAPSGGGMCLLADEETRHAFVVLIGYSPSLEAPNRQEAIALIAIAGVVQTVFGYPNEDAYWKDPRGDLSAGVYEVVGSSWSNGISDYNRRTFGADYQFNSRATNERPRHFFIGSKDGSAQFLAEGIELDVFPGSRFADVRAEALTRLDRA